MRQYGWISDTHIGLLTEGIDRTDEIIDVMIQFANHCIKHKFNGVIIGGDIFDRNTPDPYLIKRLMKVLDMFRKVDMRVWIIVGNHDAVAKKGRKSCLDFLKETKFGYPNIDLISDIKCVRIARSEAGDCYFTFLPHISKAHIDLKKYKSVQDYINKKARSIHKKIGAKEIQHYVFSHLNVEGAIPGSEEDMMKTSEIFLPPAFLKFNLNKWLPTIVQAHHHQQQQIDNVHIVGSSIFVTAGEKEKNKYFAVISIPEMLGDCIGGLTYIKTNCRPLLQYEFDLVGKSDFDVKELKRISKKWKGNEIVKVSFIVEENLAQLPWNKYQKQLAKKCFLMKDIKPKIIRSRTKRNRKQKITLKPKEAVKVWLKKNKPEGAKRKLKLAVKIIEACG